MARMPKRRQSLARCAKPAIKREPLPKDDSLALDCLECVHRRTCQYKYKFSQWKDKIYPVLVECCLRDTD